MKAITNEQWCVEIFGGESRLIYVRIKNRSILVEWEASVGLWSIPVKTYLALGSDQPVIARVEAELDNAYFYDYTDQVHNFQSISLEVIDYGSLHGYVERNSPVFHELMGILSDGNSHAITVEISNTIRRTELPRITRVLSRTWIYPMPEDVV